jgi:arylsulfatase A-like enzyme
MSNVTRREFLEATVATAAVAASAATIDAQQSRPNILFIMADDLGYGDLSCYGRPDYETPVLDRMARDGIRFTSNYAAAPVCTPTRCALATGRYHQRLRVGLEEPLNLDSSLDVGLPAGHPTLSSLLRANGYDTALVGKWHLGWKPEFAPNRHGYTEFFGSLSGATDFFTHRSSDMPGGVAAEGGGEDLWENLTLVERTGYLTDLLTDKAIEIISRPRTAPLFLSLHYTAPHSPWEGPEDAGMSHTSHGGGPMIDGGSLRTFASMMRSMDAGIGRVLQALERQQLERSTLVIFTSDNGGERYSYHWPFSFQKFFLYEGGIRVPAIARWPGVIPAGRVTDHAAITMDWSATVLAAAGTRPDPAYPLDGEDLTLVLSGRRDAYDRTLCWRIRRFDAIRSGPWKYLKEPQGEHLFNVVEDPGEKADLRQVMPDRFEALRAQYQQWAAQMLPLP